jgi:mitochondrial fission protein ELM1
MAVPSEESGQLVAPPRVWALVGDRTGDNRQTDSVAEALGWPLERKYLRVSPPYAETKPTVVPSIEHLDPARTDPLEAPWPDLVITMGRRLSMVALWIRQQSRGRTKLVLVGKPSGQLDEFDLIVTSAENPLPRRPNVLQVQLPLLRLDELMLKNAEALWAPRLSEFGRPIIALLVGGPTKPFLFPAEAAERMIQRVTRFATDQGASLFVTTSPRTPKSFQAILERELRAGDALHSWAADSSDNPYLGLLALAESFIVTGDSISMLVEVARLGKPLAIYPLEVGKPRLATRLRRALAGLILSSTAKDGAVPLLEPLGYALYRTGRIRHARDFEAIHRNLIEQDLAVPFGDEFPPAGRGAPDELPGVVRRIKAMMQKAQE